jgi:pimeloyl-ACP methyl ester carboxylesterase
MPRAEIHVMDNVGHLPHAERVDEFVDIVCR